MLEATCGDHFVHPLLKQGDIKPTAQDHVWTAFEYLCGWRIDLSGQPVPVVSHPHSKEVFPYVHVKLC